LVMSVQLPPEVLEAIKEAMSKVDWEGFDKDRVNRVINEVLGEIDAVQLHYLEDCVGCAACAPACPYYAVGEEYGPVEKAEHMRHIYRKEATILGKLLGPLLNAKKPSKPEHLDMLVELVYRCTNCGACYINCPFGIDSGAIIKGLMSTLVSKAGRLPLVLAVFDVLERKRLFMKIPALQQIWSDVMTKAEKALGKPLPYEQQGADYYLFVSLADAMFYPGAVIGAMKILDRAGVKWTLHRWPLAFRPPISAVVGFSDGVKEVLGFVNEEIEKLSPKNVVVLDGGFVYPWMRFQLPKVLGKRPGYRVLHIAELVVQLLREGRIRLNPSDDAVTWHDPCQLGRRSGVTEEPVEALRAASKGFRLLPHHGAESYCCGGGGGIGCLSLEMIENIAKIIGIDASMFLSGEKEKEFLVKTHEAWKIAVKRKVDDIKKSGAKIVVTACPVCMYSIEGGAKLYGLDIEVKHFAEYIAERLA
jgi:Fe-S oxidoreductase